MTQCEESFASKEDSPRGTKINLINNFFRRRISEIKLKRTDTTLDLSQKAKRAKEKRRLGLDGVDASKVTVGYGRVTVWCKLRRVKSWRRIFASKAGGRAGYQRDWNRVSVRLQTKDSPDHLIDAGKHRGAV